MSYFIFYNAANEIIGTCAYRTSVRAFLRNNEVARYAMFSDDARVPAAFF